MLFTTDKKRLRQHFLKDPVLFAYHLGDLDDFYFPHCQWAVTYDDKSKVNNALLTYHGCEPPALLALGLSESLRDLLADYLPIAPRKFYGQFQRQHHDLLKRFAVESPFGTFVKMLLNIDAFDRSGRSRVDSGSGGIVRLGEADQPALRELYDLAYPENRFVPRMLQTGRYFGAHDAGRLIAVTGVHVVSDQDNIAALGNITTHPEHQGKGLATQLTARLCTELIDEGKQVCLNVKADNAAAIRCYRKLGFTEVVEFEESLFELL